MGHIECADLQPSKVVIAKLEEAHLVLLKEKADVTALHDHAHGDEEQARQSQPDSDSDQATFENPDSDHATFENPLQE